MILILFLSLTAATVALLRTIDSSRVELCLSRGMQNLLHDARAVLAFLVVLGHVRQQFWVIRKDAPPTDLTSDAFYLLSGFQGPAVTLFFLMSGLLITSKYATLLASQKLSLRTFVLQRSLRIYIVLVPILVVTAIVELSASRSLSVAQAIGHLLFLQPQWAESYESNLPLWSLGYEGQCYLLFGAFVYLMQRRRNPWARTLVLGVTLALLSLTKHLVLYASFWVWGALAAALISWVSKARVAQKEKVRHIFQRAGAPLGCLFVGALIWSRVSRDLGATQTLICLFAASLLISLQASNFSYKKARLHSLSASSFSLYALHYPLLMAYTRATSAQPVAPSLLSLLHIIALTVVLVFLGWVFAQLTERHTQAVRNWCQERLS